MRFPQIQDKNLRVIRKIELCGYALAKKCSKRSVLK